MGGTDALCDKRVREAAARFRAIAFCDLKPSHLARSELSPTERIELIAARKPAALNEVDAFISHSWSDDGQAKCARRTPKLGADTASMLPTPPMPHGRRDAACPCV